MIPIDPLIDYLVIDMKNDHPLINLYWSAESANRGTTVLQIPASRMQKTKFLDSPTGHLYESQTHIPSIHLAGMWVWQYGCLTYLPNWQPVCEFDLHASGWYVSYHYTVVPRRANDHLGYQIPDNQLANKYILISGLSANRYLLIC